MSLTQYYTATTLDGFIADPDHSLAWLFTRKREPGGPLTYDAFIADVGAIAMGSTTYEWILDHEFAGKERSEWRWPYDVPRLTTAATGAKNGVWWPSRSAAISQETPAAAAHWTICHRFALRRASRWRIDSRLRSQSRSMGAPSASMSVDRARPNPRARWSSDPRRARCDRGRGWRRRGGPERGGGSDAADEHGDRLQGSWSARWSGHAVLPRGEVRTWCRR